MTQPLQDNGRPVRQGDPSFVFRGVYHPIVWYNGEPYRPRVETLVIKNSRYVYLKMYSDKEASKQERLSPYELPGGSIDADCDRLKQAENEVNEEILAKVKNIYQTNVQYFEVFSDENVEMYKKESPLSYRGFVTDVFCAEYAGKFDANKVEDKDLDPEMQQGGWYAITLVADKLSEPHMEAILQCPFVDNSVKQTLRLYYNKPKESVTEATGVKKPIYVVNMHYKSLFGNAVRRFTGSDFNHSAISFDSTLSEMYTFIREKTSDDERPNGFSVETIDSMLNKDKNTMIKVVRFDIPEDNYNALAERIGHNKRNNTSGYDFSTIIRVPIKLDKTTDDGKFVCSTFVANSLKTAGVRLQKPVNLMTPDDVSKIKGGEVVYDGRLDEYNNSVKELAKYIDVTESVTEKTIYNDEGEIVPEVCPKCGSKVGIFIQGEPVYLCTNKECRIFFGVVPFNSVEEMKRSELPNEVFGVPEQRKYPLESEKHVRSAIKLFNHVDKKYEAELAKNIIKKMDEYGIGDIEVGPNNRFGNYYKSSVREGLLEASLKSTIDKDFKPKGKKSLSSFQRVKITKSNIKQYTAMTGNLLRHTNPNDNIYLYLDNGNPVGAVSVESEALSDGTKWITGIEVMEEYQGYGLGSQLLDVAMYEFGGNGLTCVKGNDIAKRMYEKRGFKARNPKGEIDKLSGLVVYYMYLPEVFPNGLNESYMVATKKPKKFFNVTEATSIKKTTYTAFTIKEADKVADKLIKDSNPTIQSFGHSLKRGILSNFENFVDILGKINGLFYAGLVVTPYMLSVVVSTLLLLVTSTPYSLIASALEKQKRFLRNAVRKEDKYLQKYHDVLDIVIRSEGIESVTESFSIVMEAPANEEDTAEDENDAVTDYTDEVEDEEDPGEDNDNVTDYTDEVDTDEEDAPEEETPDENDEVTDYTDEVDPEEDEPTPTAADDGGETTDDTDTTTADTGETDADTDTGTGDNTDTQATDDAGEEDPGAGDETEGETTDDVDTATDYTDEDTVDDAETDDAETTDNTADEAGADEENGDSNQNSIVKNYNLILDFQQLYRLLEDLTTTLEATVFKSPIQNVALAQIIKNMKRLRESVSNYIEFNFGNDYTTNLYNYNIFLKALKLILEMLQTTKDLVTDNSNK